MAKFRNLKVRTTQLKSRFPIITLPENQTRSPDSAERSTLYAKPRWKRLRHEQLQGDNAKCFFCGAPSEVLEHIIGHGDDAQQVADVLGLGTINQDWRARFWHGPFCGSCQTCARSRSGAEKSHRLVRWTERWLKKRQADPRYQQR